MAAGKVDFPGYMKNSHENWLDGGASGDVNTALTKSVVDVMNTAHGTNPFSSLSAADPSSDLSTAIDAVSSYYTLANGMDHVSDWKNIVDQAGYDSIGVDTYDSVVTDQLEAETLPKFNAGMRNIGAVMTSAFSIGQAQIYAFKNRDVNKHASDIAREGVKHMLQLYTTKIDAVKNWMASVIEVRRIKIVSEKEQLDTDNSLAESQAKWDLEVFQYGANLMAAISGAPTITSPRNKQTSAARSAVGGALSGAALGGMVGKSFFGEGGSGWGALAGAALGAGASFL
jgi:hypothetical protein